MTLSPLALAESYDWATQFRSFSLQHLATLLLFGGSMVGSAALGRRWHGTPKELLLRRGWIVTTVAWQIMATIYFLAPSRFNAYESWPLHLCDIAAWVAPVALLTQVGWVRGWLYFWGVGLSTQAFFTPVVEGGHGDFRYWLFFVGHTQIVGSAVYDVVALGYRPTLRHWGIMSLISLGWLVVVTLLNVAFDVNYGYTGRVLPDGPTLLDHLGPWPWRILWLTLAGQGVCAIAYFAWARNRRFGTSRPAESAQNCQPLD